MLVCIRSSAKSISKYYKMRVASVTVYVNEYKLCGKISKLFKSCGRKPKASKATDRLIVRSVIALLENRKKSSAFIATHLRNFDIEISQRPVRLRLVQRYYDSKTTYKKSMLRKANVNRRLEWAVNIKPRR